MTAQIHEILILDGVHTSMTSCPQPPGGNRLRALPHANSDSPPAGGPRPTATFSRDGSLINSTACWRGYQGIWEVRDDRLYFCGFSERFLLASPLFADWVSATLVVPEGQLVQYVHMGFDSVYEREIHVTVERGIVTGRTVIHNADAQAAAARRREKPVGWISGLFTPRAPSAKERIRALRRRADRDAELTDRRCPKCDAPCPRYRRTCRVCGHEIGRV